MNKKLVCTLAVTFMAVSCFSQTKKVAHHSHSGSDASMVADGADNFGISPQMETRRDSLRNARKQQDSLRIVQYKDSLDNARKKAQQKRSKK